MILCLNATLMPFEKAFVILAFIVLDLDFSAPQVNMMLPSHGLSWALVNGCSCVTGIATKAELPGRSLHHRCHHGL